MLSMNHSLLSFWTYSLYNIIAILFSKLQAASQKFHLILVNNKLIMDVMVS